MPKKRVDPIIESVTLEPELEEALASATDAELCDIAGKIVPYLFINLQLPPFFFINYSYIYALASLSS